MSTKPTFTHQYLTPSSTATPHPTSTPGTFYFAYGSNLSPTQMSLRCTADPVRSSRPVAIARLHGWKWIICGRGGNEDKAEDEEEDEVWGVVYDLDSADEQTLDTYEGVDWAAPRTMTTTKDGVERPTEQGVGRHNKVYLEVEIVQWKAGEWGSGWGWKGEGVGVSG
ncbi:hypothetical protein N0V90_005024 [Kalmusia sp. IMI 367209]|nr:hypothetical protein N0V90_005024 [Kalmusia sp. IMI 367209]